MRDLAFVIAGYGVILGGLAAYALLLLRRLARIHPDDRRPGDGGE